MPSLPLPAGAALAALLLAAPAWGARIDGPSRAAQAADAATTGAASTARSPAAADGAASSSAAPGGKPTALDGGLKEAKGTGAPSAADG